MDPEFKDLEMEREKRRYERQKETFNRMAYDEPVILSPEYKPILHGYEELASYTGSSGQKITRM